MADQDPNPPPFVPDYLSISPVESVSHRTVISGRVSPSQFGVQLLVLSADQNWYLQADACACHDGGWSIEAAFGIPGEGQSLHPFTIVAVANARVQVPIIPEAQIHQFIPVGAIVSDPLTVNRVA